MAGEIEQSHMTLRLDMAIAVVHKPFPAHCSHVSLPFGRPLQNSFVGRLTVTNGVATMSDYQRWRTWWTGVRDNKPLLDLQNNLTDKLVAAGFKLDRRKYNPHITFGREVITSVMSWKIEQFEETVSNIDLMKSERIGGKLTYTAIYSKWAAI